MMTNVAMAKNKLRIAALVLLTGASSLLPENKYTNDINENLH